VVSTCRSGFGIQLDPQNVTVACFVCDVSVCGCGARVSRFFLVTIWAWRSNFKIWLGGGWAWRSSFKVRLGSGLGVEVEFQDSA
jgi:hypothetical protein